MSKKPPPKPAEPIKRGPGRPPGKSRETTPFTSKVYASVTPEQKRALEKEVLQRKLENDGLPARWGMSDLLRELIEMHLNHR